MDTRDVAQPARSTSFRPPSTAFQQMLTVRLHRSSSLIRSLVIMIVALAGMTFAFSHGNALLVLSAFGLGGLLAAAASGFAYLSVASVRLEIVGDQLLRHGLLGAPKAAPAGLLKHFVRCTVDWGYGTLQPVWFVTDLVGSARFWLDADVWPEAVIQDLAKALGAKVEGDFDSKVDRSELPTRFPGPRQRW